MLPPITGLHHVTAMCGDPQRNVDFYAGVLGLRLVKRTVNFDDPSTYHLYYGDAFGSPGTLLTFFAWPGARRGRRGTGQVAVTALRILASSVSFWLERLHTNQVVGVDVGKRDGATVISLADPDGMRLELVAIPGADDAKREGAVWRGGPVNPEHAIRALHGVTVELAATPKTVALLTEVMGLQPADAEVGHRQRFRTVGSDGEKPTQFIELVAAPDDRPGQVSVGFAHHIAWRAQDAATQAAWRENSFHWATRLVRSSTALISTPSISGNRAACSLRSPRTRPALPPTERLSKPSAGTCNCRRSTRDGALLWKRGFRPSIFLLTKHRQYVLQPNDHASNQRGIYPSASSIAVLPPSRHSTGWAWSGRVDDAATPLKLDNTQSTNPT